MAKRTGQFKRISASLFATVIFFFCAAGTLALAKTRDLSADSYFNVSGTVLSEIIPVENSNNQDPVVVHTNLFHADFQTYEGSVFLKEYLDYLAWDANAFIRNAFLRHPNIHAP